MTTGFQSSIKKSNENSHPFYEIWNQFWGSFLSEQSVFCWSKISLTCGPLKIVILASPWHPKSLKLEVISWCKFNRFWRWWDKQCISIRSWYQDPGTKILVPSSWYQDLSSQILVPRTWYLPRSWYRDPGTKILVTGSWCQDPGTRILVPRSWHQAWYQDSGTKILVLANRC